MLLAPEIVILDEATSAIDIRTESLAFEELPEADEGKTSLVVAHRLSTIRKSDLIVVLKDGAKSSRVAPTKNCSQRKDSTLRFTRRSSIRL
jgi:ABC-type transport system involved in Fe-S cluster assembly fused permease/ATPase subunit